MQTKYFFSPHWSSREDCASFGSRISQMTWLKLFTVAFCVWRLKYLHITRLTLSQPTACKMPFVVFEHLLSDGLTVTQKLTGIFWKLVGQICLWLTGTVSSQHSSSADNVTDDRGGLYTGHIPTSLFQKMLLFVGSSAMAITCPWRGGMCLFIWQSLYNERFDLPAQPLSVFIV